MSVFYDANMRGYEPKETKILHLKCDNAFGKQELARESFT